MAMWTFILMGKWILKNALITARKNLLPGKIEWLLKRIQSNIKTLISNIFNCESSSSTIYQIHFVCVSVCLHFWNSSVKGSLSQSEHSLRLTNQSEDSILSAVSADSADQLANQSTVWDLLTNQSTVLYQLLAEISCSIYLSLCSLIYFR